MWKSSRLHIRTDAPLEIEANVALTSEGPGAEPPSSSENPPSSVVPPSSADPSSSAVPPSTPRPPPTSSPALTLTNPLMIRKLSRDLEPGLREPPPPPPEPDPVRKKWWKHLYDKERKTFCDRTSDSWLKIISYSVMYIIFLSTYTMIFLYFSLLIIKGNEVYMEKHVMYFRSEVGLTATPLEAFSQPMIWYNKEDSGMYEKYVNTLEKLVSPRRKRDLNMNKILGPCSAVPFGYGDSPCIIVRLNKQWGWSARPLRYSFSKEVPSKVRQWARKDNKLWLHCGGNHPHDEEHIGSVKYYPDPPGFDPGAFPLNSTTESPLIGVQFSNFTLGVSIAVECKLWYEDGSSSVDFVLYVDSSRKARS